jgi:two-component system, OmpR family, sensor histidine kinase BaeS
MAEGPKGSVRRRGSVTARLAVAFVGVALAAVALFAALTVVIESRDVSGLARAQADDLARAVAAASAAAYRAHDGWTGADLSDALAIGRAVGGDVRITNAGGATVGSVPGKAGFIRTEATARVAVVVDGIDVGRVDLGVGASGVGRSDSHLRHVLAVGLAGSAAAAGLLAVGAAVIVADRITRPLRRLTVAARAMTSGRRDVRVGALPGDPRELAELAEAYDALGATVAEEDRLRRSTAAHVAHELRTPAAIILAASEAMLDGVTEADPEALSSLRDEALRLADRIEDLETLSQASAARLSLQPRATDLSGIATGAAHALSERYAAAGVALERRLTSVWVSADPDRLHQVVTNLLTNAAKFSPTGSVVRLTVGATEVQGYLEVSDSGPGIEADEAAHVFEPFWRGRAATTVAGSGIGLAVVAELVGAHGGEVSLVSEPGQGSSFRVSLPLVVPARSGH